MVDLTRAIARITAVVLLILVGMQVSTIWALALDTRLVVEARSMEVEEEAEEEEEDTMVQGVLQVVVIILMDGSR